MLKAIFSMADKVLGKFSNAERRRRRRNKIDKLREKRMEVCFRPPSAKNSALLNSIDRKLSKLHQESNAE